MYAKNQRCLVFITLYTLKAKPKLKTHCQN